jgi:hypothetical protein
MPNYRCYFLNELGKPVDAEVVDQPTDRHAEQHAIALLHARPSVIEITQGERQIAYQARSPS